MGNTRNIAIAIGVGDAQPLPYLRGAINAAHAFHDWASKLGYESELVTDENEPVTLARLRFELESHLGPQGDPIHRMLLYFAGHGLIVEAEKGLWMLSDWNKELRAVSIEVLRRRLYMYDIQQIAIFSDSCRSLPSNMTAADLSPDPVLGRGPCTDQNQLAIDKFIAAQDGTPAYIVPALNASEDRCLFSGVLMDGLWGINPGSKSATGKVTSQSLKTYLNTEVPRVAALYQHKLLPTVWTNFPDDDNIYFEGPPPVPPSFPPWPPPDVVAAMSATMKAKGIAPGIAKVPPGDILIKEIRNQPRPDHFETGAGFAVDGGAVRDIWTPLDTVAESHGQANWWRLHDRSQGMLSHPVPVLIEFEDGIFAAIAAMPNFIATVLRKGPGISALIYRHIYEGSASAAAAENAIGKMESGALRIDDATDLAASLMETTHSDPVLGRISHLDPVLGVIAAYLYDSVGDINNIRRMAFYYASANQPIPYDIALLADLRAEWSGGGLLAYVPAVPRGLPRADVGQSMMGWTHSETVAAAGPVGGFWPWLRQGWTFFDNPTEYESTLIGKDLIGLSAYLAPGRFTTFAAEGGHKLIKIFGLSNHR